MLKKENYIEIVALIVFALIVVHLLFIDPVIGLSDNGDFNRIMSSTGLGYFEPNDNDYFGFVHTKFMLKNLDINSLTLYFTTHNIPVIIAKILSKISSKNTFDTKYLSFVYAVFLLFSFFLIIRNVEFYSKQIKMVFIFMFLIILSDANCMSYFNSLYGEPVAYVSLISLIACFLTLLKQNQPKIITLILLFLCMFMIVGSKLQYNILSIFVIVLLLMMFKLRNDKKWRIITSICSILTILYSLWLNMAISKPLTNLTIYNSVFYGILKDSENPKQDLVDLGLNTDFSALVNTTRFDKNKYYDLDGDYFKSQFINKVDYQKIVKYYLAHPKRLVEKMEVTAKKSMQNDKIQLGNYERKSGYGFMTIVNRFNLWTKLKRRFLPKTVLFMIPFYGIFFILSLIKYIKSIQYKEKRIMELLWCISFIGLLQFPLPVIGNGEADTYKQLFLFNTTYDILILTSITYCLAKAMNVIKSSNIWQRNKGDARETLIFY
jgi:hypothetical protein